jgi:thioredoxin reductase
MDTSSASDPAVVWDVMIIGAGPAGLSAALVLARCCRTVMLCDRGTPRSWASKAIYGFVTRDGIHPDEFRNIAHEELHKFSNATLIHADIQQVHRTRERFEVEVNGEQVLARKLLIATGVMDEVPDIEGFRELFGSSVFQCPYCDAWEFKDRPVAVFGAGKRGLEMGRALTAWTHDIAVCTNGPSELMRGEREQLQRNGITLIEDRIVKLHSSHGRLTHLEFEGGERLARDAVFFDTPSRSQSHLTEALGCQFDADGAVVCDRYEATNVPGLYVAGNIVKDVQLSIVAAAEGARAAFGINRDLTREDFYRRAEIHSHHAWPVIAQRATSDAAL